MVLRTTQARFVVRSTAPATSSPADVVATIAEPRSYLLEGVVAIVPEQTGAGPRCPLRTIGAKQAPFAHIPAPAPAAKWFVMLTQIFESRCLLAHTQFPHVQQCLWQVPCGASCMGKGWSAEASVLAPAIPSHAADLGHSLVSACQFSSASKGRMFAAAAVADCRRRTSCVRGDLPTNPCCRCSRLSSSY